MKHMVTPWMRDPEQGSGSTVWAALSPEVEEKDYQGVYVTDPGVVGGETAQASDRQLGDNLWKLSEQMITEKLGPKGLLSWKQD